MLKELEHVKENLNPKTYAEHKELLDELMTMIGWEAQSYEETNESR